MVWMMQNSPAGTEENQTFTQSNWCRLVYSEALSVHRHAWSSHY